MKLIQIDFLAKLGILGDIGWVSGRVFKITMKRVKNLSFWQQSTLSIN